MVSCALAALAAVVLVGASLVPEDASARRGGGGGYRGGEAFMAGFMLAVLASGRMPAGYAGRGYAGAAWIADTDIIR